LLVVSRAALNIVVATDTLALRPKNRYSHREYQHSPSKISTWRLAIMHLEFFLDYISPYAYLANTQIRQLGTKTEYRPVDIITVMKQVNNRPTLECPAKLRYAGIDAKRCATHRGIRFSPNWSLLQAVQAGRVRGALFSHAGLAAQELDVFDVVNNALFDAIWIGTDHLTSEEGRKAFLTKLPLVASDLWRLAEDQLIRDRMAEECNAAADRGVFGVPTFFVNDEMFFGNDRLDFLVQITRAEPV
jgi:2-hydroxychromene-2-carboxylate isomerase